MGRFVDLTRPITDDEREYLKSRCREGEIAVNDRQFGHLGEPEKANLQGRALEDEETEQEERRAFEDAVAEAEADAFPAHIVEKIEPLTVNQLRQALAKRNLDDSGEKLDLQVRLAEFLENAEQAKAAAISQ